MSTNISASDDESVPVAPTAPNLDIVKTAGEPTKGFGENPDVHDAGDRITYTYQLTNTGNTTLSNVLPVDLRPKFNGNDGTNTLSDFTLIEGQTTLAPYESATFTADYELSELDILRASGVENGVTNIAYAMGDLPNGETYSDPENTDQALTQILAAPDIRIVKTYQILDGDDDLADFGERILYSYAVTNNGTAPMRDVQVSDTHEGAGVASELIIHNPNVAVEGPLGASDGVFSLDDNDDPAIWGLLQPGATVIFTYEHTVTQDEINDG